MILFIPAAGTGRIKPPSLPYPGDNPLAGEMTVIQRKLLFPPKNTGGTGEGDTDIMRFLIRGENAVNPDRDQFPVPVQKAKPQRGDLPGRINTGNHLYGDIRIQIGIHAGITSSPLIECSDTKEPR